jgi:uncharacterized protein
MNSTEVVQRTRHAATQVLKRQGYVSAVDVFVELGTLKKQDLEDWRRGRVPYLEERLQGGLGNLSRMLRAMQKLCREFGLQPRHTAYNRWGKGPKSPLRFSKNGEPNVEQAYATHWVSERFLRQASAPPAKTAAAEAGKACEAKRARSALGALQKDSRVVRQLGEAKRHDNLTFRAFLKQGPVSMAEVDRMFHAYYELVSAAIDCTSCASCCCSLPVGVGRADARRLATELGQSLADFRREYLKKSDWGDVFARSPCPFLQGTRCSVYEQRPAVCRSYPHLQKRDMPTRMLQVVGNAEVCPIVYNVVECVKAELGTRWRRARPVPLQAAASAGRRPSRA